MDSAPNYTYRNVVVEVRLDGTSAGVVTGVGYVRTVLVNDPAPPPQGLASPFDLDPKGLTINAGSTGVAANGNLVVGSGTDFVRGFDLATGAFLSGGFHCDPPNDDLEDVAWVPQGGGRLYTVDQQGPSRIEVFGSGGNWIGGFGVGTSSSPPAAGGYPKGIAWLPEAPSFPRRFLGQGGVLLVSLDDGGPALQVFSSAGNLVAYEPLLPPTFAGGTQVLAIEGVAADPSTGRIALAQQGANGANEYLWLLTPDCNGNSVADALDLAGAGSSDENGDGIPDECQPLGPAACFGDGTGAPCPCGNQSSFGANMGCLNSLGAGGSLRALGDARVASDSALLIASGLPASSALFFQGTQLVAGGNGAAFGDGLRCASGSTVRLGALVASGGEARWPAAVGTLISVLGGVSAGDVRQYQVWYRNAASFCTPATFNLTNAVAISWSS
jgi:hypothetical protein